MIIDLLILNVIGWSIYGGYKHSTKKILLKVICLISAILITITVHQQIRILDYDKVAYTISQKNYAVPVGKDTVKDYVLAKSFVEELPVTTEMQNKVLEIYYKENSGYLADELMSTSSQVVGKLMEMLLIFVIILVALNMFGFILQNKWDDKKQPKTSIARASCIVVNLMYNIVGVFTFIILTKWINYFLLGSFPDISLQGSAFKPLIYKAIDTIIKIL